jgi:hypothetical protein
VLKLLLTVTSAGSPARRACTAAMAAAASESLRVDAGTPPVSTSVGAAPPAGLLP